MLIDTTIQLSAGKLKIAESDGSPTSTAWNFFKALFDRTGQGSGIPDKVTTGIAAAGAVWADATLLTTDVNEVMSGAGGVLLADLAQGQWQEVYNGSGGAINVYPQADQIIDNVADILARPGPYVLASGKTQRFRAYSATQLRSLQLG